METLTTTAYDYISEGFGALPLYSKKTPQLPKDHPYLYALIPDDSITSLFERAEKIGIACGEVSDGFGCLDFDAHGSEPIQQIFNKFMQDETVKSIIDNHQLPVSSTMSGGFHIYFKSEEKRMPGRCLARWEAKEGQKESVMIEFRGHGQYVCLFPSEGYKQISGSEIIKVSTLTSDEVDTLFAIAESFDQTIKAPETEKKGSGKWATEFDTSKPIGRYNETELDHAKGLLEAAGWSFVRIRKHDNVELWLRPGKDAEKNGSISCSATIGKFHNMFYSFTESNTTFKTRTGYNPFDILKKLQFNDNFQDALTFVKDRYAEPVALPESQPEPTGATPPMPISGFPDFIQQLINECSRIYGTHPDLWASAFLSATAAALGQSVILKTKFENPSLFWIATVGPSGSGKSEPGALAYKPIHKIDYLAFDAYKKQAAQYKANVKADPKGKHDEPLPCRQTVLNDATPEALATALSANKRGVTIVRDELHGWLNDFGKYQQSGEQQNMLSGWSQQTFKVNRKSGDNLFITDPFINVYGGIQPGVLPEMAKDNRANNGFLPRFCFVFPDKIQAPKYTDEEINTDYITRYSEYIANLLSIDTYREIVRLNTDASKLYESFYNKNAELNNAGSQPDYLNEVNSKLNIIVLRTALLFHMSQFACTGECESFVSGKTMEAAIELAEYFRITAKKVYNLISNQGMERKDLIWQLAALGNSQNEIAHVLKYSQQNVSKALKKAGFQKEGV